MKFMDESASFYTCFPLSPCLVLFQCSPYLGDKKEVKSTGLYLIRDSAVLSVLLYNRLKDFFSLSASMACAHFSFHEVL